MTTTIETIHGFPIIKSTRLPARKGDYPARVILVDRGEEYGPERYVTAVLCDGSASWIWGHYIETLTEASQDFDRRVKRGY